MLIFLYNSNDKPYRECQVIVLAKKYDVKPYTMGFQKDSPYLGLFNYQFKKMKERGVLKETLAKNTPKQVCPDMNGKPLGINSSFTAFIWLTGKYKPKISANFNRPKKKPFF